MINPISMTNTTFTGKKSTKVPITQKHINIVTDSVHSGLIEEMNRLGLINRTMLQRVRKEVALRDAQSVARSFDAIADIIKHPRYAVEMRDNGYWMETESKYNPHDTVQTYMKGQTYSTPVFTREREYAQALDVIAKKAEPKDYKKAQKFIKDFSRATQALDHVETLRSIDKTTRLHFCIPKEGAFGKLVPLNRQNAFKFVSDTLVTPFLSALKSAMERIKAVR